MTTGVDVLIFGGGGAGLWLLDELRRRGVGALLIERSALGDGQSIAAQGIIHGGVKYSLGGRVGGAAKAIRDMPDRWRRSLAADAEPDLSAVRMRSEHCWLWRSGGIGSRLGLIGARAALVVRPRAVERHARPAPLADCPGDVFRLDEPVIDPASLLAVLAQRNERLLIRGVPDELTRDHVRIAGLDLRPRRIVLAAGAGNAELCQRLDLAAPAALMQRRPLHMTLVRGRLPVLNGHCVDAGGTRVTITTDASVGGGEVVWQVGGQIAEDGVAMQPDALIDHARREIALVLPGVDLGGARWATHRVDRAEAATPDRSRPDDVQIVADDRVLVVWPTKLALIPHAVDLIVGRLSLAADAEGGGERIGAEGVDAPRPPVASPPWSTAAKWTSDR